MRGAHRRHGIAVCGGGYEAAECVFYLRGAGGTNYFALLREQPLPAGTAVVGFLAQDGPGQKTVTVPRSAIVYHEGSAWVFVLGEKDAFQRRRIEIGQALTESCAVTSGISEKDRIVTVGAQQLLSSELQAATGGE